MVEWHKRLEKQPERKNTHQVLEGIMRLLSNYSVSMKERGARYDFSVLKMDDEKYLHSKFELPMCKDGRII